MSKFLLKANELIGQPYNKKTNHCYSLVMQLLPNAPKIEAIAEGVYNSVKKISKEIEIHKLKEIENFKDEDIILLGRDKIYHHVGVYYNGGVIHSDLERGVVYDNMVQLKKIYPDFKGLRV